jgi:carboxypeptidase PM20D1
MERTLRTVDDPRVQIRPIGRITSNPSSISDTGSPSFQVLQRTIHQVFPGVLVAPGLVVGATDSRQFSGVSRNILRFTPMRMGPEDLGRIHGTDERLSVENYKEIIRFFVQLIHNSAQ